MNYNVVLLLPHIQACRKRLEAERAAETLQKALASCRGLADLPKLEAAILNARKAGGAGGGVGGGGGQAASAADREGGCPVVADAGEVFRAASEMLARLNVAAKW